MIEWLSLLFPLFFKISVLISSSESMSIESTLGSMSFKGTLEGLWRSSQPDYLKLLSRVLLVCIQLL